MPSRPTPLVPPTPRGQRGTKCTEPVGAENSNPTLNVCTLLVHFLYGGRIEPPLSKNVDNSDHITRLQNFPLSKISKIRFFVDFLRHDVVHFQSPKMGFFEFLRRKIF